MMNRSVSMSMLGSTCVISIMALQDIDSDLSDSGASEAAAENEVTTAETATGRRVLADCHPRKLPPYVKQV